MFARRIPIGKIQHFVDILSRTSSALHRLTGYTISRPWNIYPKCRMATEPMSYHDEMYKLLDEHSTQKYYIEYRGFLSNHVSHGIYALERIHAPLSRASDMIQWHAENKLENAEEHRQRELKEDPRPQNVDELIGMRTSFYYLYEHYQELLKTKYDSSLEALIAGEFPKLTAGLIGSALHGIIHLGYGYASRREWFVLEGLAYLHHSSVPLTLSHDAPGLETLGLGSMNILDVLEEIRQDKALIDVMLEGKGIPERIRAKGFQRKAYVLTAFKGDELAKYVHKIQFPSGLNARDFLPDRKKDLAKWLVDCSIIVYAIAEKPNDFFLVHGVTGCWSVKNLLLLLEDSNSIMEATRTLLCALLTAYLCQNHPGLQRNLLSENNGMTREWDELMKMAAEIEQYEEEHFYKLVQVCHDMSQENTDPTMESLYRLASYHCVTNPLTF